MELPQGKTCGDCYHFARTCEWLISAKPDRTVCDWFPRRFHELEPYERAKSNEVVDVPISMLKREGNGPIEAVTLKSRADHRSDGQLWDAAIQHLEANGHDSADIVKRGIANMSQPRMPTQREVNQAYNKIVDNLRLRRMSPSWKPEDDREDLAALEDLFGGLSPDDQKVANVEHVAFRAGATAMREDIASNIEAGRIRLRSSASDLATDIRGARIPEPK